MRGDVPTQRTSSYLTSEARRLAASALVVVVTACSVYSSSLVDGSAEPVTQGGSQSEEGGKGGSAAGKPAGGGASGTGDAPSLGGEGGEPETSGGSAGSAGSSTDGGTSGSGGATGGGGGMSAGGTAGTGATAGTGGAPTPITLIDDFEDGNLTLKQVGGRGGVWYTFHDATTGTITPSPLSCTELTETELASAPEELGRFVMHITATGFTDYGSGLGTDFRAAKRPFDASEYAGIRFWARVGAGKNPAHRVQIADKQTDAVGELCNSAANAPVGAKCEDHFGADIAFTSAWKQYTLVFADLRQLGWGYPDDPDATIDTKEIYGLQFTAGANKAVDLWIDAIEFF